MKLNNRLFWKKSRFLTNCFSCFSAKKLVLVFLVGLFALSGLFSADAKIVATEGGVSSSWSRASWVDSNGNSVQAPINTGDDAILNAMNGAITLTLENDLTITDLFVYGEFDSCFPIHINIPSVRFVGVHIIIIQIQC